MIDQFIIVDEHAHTYPKEKANKILTTFTLLHKLDPTHLGKGTVEEVLANMQRNSIDYTILANFAPAKILPQNNLWTISLSKKNDCLIPLVSLHPNMEGSPLELLKKYIKLGAKGIKIHSAAQGFIPDHPNLRMVYEYCNEISFPILFHCGLTSKAVVDSYANLDMLLPVIDHYKNIPIILAHMAEGNIKDVLTLSKEYKNLYFDTSIAISGLLLIERVHNDCWQNDDIVIDIIRKIGANKIIFGSDYPFGSPIHDIKRFIKMNISVDAKKMILGENAKKIFNIK